MAAARYLVQLAGTLALALWATGAEAALIGAGSILNDNLISDFSVPNELDFDADFLSAQSILLDVLLGPDDDAGELAFSAFAANSSPEEWADFRITLLGGPTFANVDEFLPETSLFFEIILSPGGTAVEILFDPPESAGFTIGNPPDPDPLDWLIDLNGLSDGDSFHMLLQPSSSAVAEPASLLLLGTGWMALVLARRRRARR